MKLEINTEDKTIKLLDNYPLKDVIKEIKKIVDNWNEYTLISCDEKWSYYPYYPITYPRYPYYPTWPYDGTPIYDSNTYEIDDYGTITITAPNTDTICTTN